MGTVEFQVMIEGLFAAIDLKIHDINGKEIFDKYIEKSPGKIQLSINQTGKYTVSMDFRVDLEAQPISWQEGIVLKSP